MVHLPVLLGHRSELLGPEPLQQGNQGELAIHWIRHLDDGRHAFGGGFAGPACLGTGFAAFALGGVPRFRDGASGTLRATGGGTQGNLSRRVLG